MASTVPTPTGEHPEYQTSGRKKSVDRVRIVTYPNIVFLYPSLLMALAAAVGLSADVWNERGWAMLFFAVLGINMVVLAFDFPRTTSLTIFFLVAAAVLGLILLNQRVEIFPTASDWFRDLSPEANATFYWMFFIWGTLILAIVLIDHRFFDYYIVESNEILHHHGILGDLDRIPSPGIRLQKEIHDIFEFMLLGSGRLIITPQAGGQPLVLEAVPRINLVARRLNEILGVTEVEINH